MEVEVSWLRAECIVFSCRNKTLDARMKSQRGFQPEMYELQRGAFDDIVRQLRYIIEISDVELFGSAKEHVPNLYCSRTENDVYFYYRPTLKIGCCNICCSEVRKFLTKVTSLIEACMGGMSICVCYQSIHLLDKPVSIPLRRAVVMKKFR